MSKKASSRVKTDVDQISKSFNKLHNQKRWLPYRREWNPNKYDGKGGYSNIPINGNGKNASWTNEQERMTFDQAISYFNRHGKGKRPEVCAGIL